MKPKPDHATLVDLAGRLERANAQARSEIGMTPADRDMRAERSERRSPRAAVAHLPAPRTNSHTSAYLGAGAVILGLVGLLLLGQLTF